MSFVIALLGISALIVLHELGHFWVARACGMRVLRFSVGFGPTLVQQRWGHTIWQLAALPVGGFVHIAGMNQEDDAEEAAALQGTDASAGVAFRDRPMWQRAAVIAAGPASNWLVCALLLALVAGMAGVAQFDESRAVLGEITPGGAADRAGLKPQDAILQVNGQPLQIWPDLVQQVRQHPEQPLSLQVARGDQVLQLTLTPERVGSSDRGIIQVLPPLQRTPLGPLAAIEAGLAGTWAASRDQVQLLSGMVRGQGNGRLTGLPGIVRTVSQQADRGLARLLETLSLLSIGLCFLNLLPVPGLDGSRLLVLGFEAASGRPIGSRAENVLNTVGFVSLVGLMLFVSVRDLIT